VNKGPNAATLIEDSSVRQSVTFTKQQHDALAQVATANNVSIGWVVRHACNLLINNLDGSTTLVRLGSTKGDD